MNKKYNRKISKTIVKMVFLQKIIFSKEINQWEIDPFKSLKYKRSQIFNNNKITHNQIIFLKKRKYNKEIKV